jgi:hypothetical protein
MELTENEQKIIEILRELKPYEEIKIQKDQLGRPDYYIITRTQKIVIK